VRKVGERVSMLGTRKESVSERRVSDCSSTFIGQSIVCTEGICTHLLGARKVGETRRWVGERVSMLGAKKVGRD
jgi:hypothetical protein